jgi:hypothetical protein
MELRWRIHGRMMPCMRRGFMESEGNAAGFEPRHRTHRKVRDVCAARRFAVAAVGVSCNAVPRCWGPRVAHTWTHYAMCAA